MVDLHSSVIPDVDLKTGLTGVLGDSGEEALADVMTGLELIMEFLCGEAFRG
jgi:hypothetical protein